MSDLAEFLLARIAEDEAGYGAFGPVPTVVDEHGAPTVARKVSLRVLAECEAKRAIVAMHADTLAGIEKVRPLRNVSDETDLMVTLAEATLLAFEVTLTALATVYADHPDYQQEWKL